MLDADADARRWRARRRCRYSRTIVTPGNRRCLVPLRSQSPIVSLTSAGIMYRVCCRPHGRRFASDPVRIGRSNYEPASRLRTVRRARARSEHGRVPQLRPFARPRSGDQGARRKQPPRPASARAVFARGPVSRPIRTRQRAAGVFGRYRARLDRHGAHEGHAGVDHRRGAERSGPGSQRFEANARCTGVFARKEQSSRHGAAHAIC